MESVRARSASLPALLVFLALSIAPSGARAADSPSPNRTFQGPLPVRLREGLTGAVYLTEPESAEVLPRGVSTLSLFADDGNTAYTLRYSDSDNGIAEQNETEALRLTYHRGLGRGWDVAATGALLARNGGYFGNFINDWHHTVLFGFHDPFRESNGPRADFIELIQDGQSIVDLPDAQASSGLIVLQARKQIVARTAATVRRPLRIAVRGGVKIPLFSAVHSLYLDNGATDLFGGVEGTLGLSRHFWMHANLDAVVAGTTQVLALSGGRRVLPQTLVAGEYILGSGTSAVVQVEQSSYPFRLHLPNRADQRRQTTFGLWRTFAARTQAFLSVSENIFGWQTSSHAPDVQFSTGVRQRL